MDGAWPTGHDSIMFDRNPPCPRSFINSPEPERERLPIVHPPTHLSSSRENCSPSSARTNVISYVGNSLSGPFGLKRRLRPALALWSPVDLDEPARCRATLARWCPHRTCGYAFKLARGANPTSPTYHFRLVRLWFATSEQRPSTKV
jgi:hypothetical protein